MNADVRISAVDDFPATAARHVAERLRRARSAVITGGDTARRVYEHLARFEGIPNLEVAFSDERAVPPDHPESNYGMARRVLLDPLGLTNIHRMRGEDDPTEAAAEYAVEIGDLVESGPDLVLLGLGDDAHIAALFPGTPGLLEIERLCIAVDRPDGMRGITLTAPALTAGTETILVAAGSSKASAVRRALKGNEDVQQCPVRLLEGASELTFLLDTDAAADLV